MVLLHEDGDGCPVDRDGVDGRLFILPHEAAIPHDIGTEDGRELPRHACGGLEGKIFAGTHEDGSFPDSSSTRPDVRIYVAPARESTLEAMQARASSNFLISTCIQPSEVSAARSHPTVSSISQTSRFPYGRVA